MGMSTSRNKKLEAIAKQHDISRSTAYRRLVEEEGSDLRLKRPGRPRSMDYSRLDWTNKDESLAAENGVSVTSIHNHRQACVHGLNRWQVRAMQIDQIINAGSQFQP